MEVWKEEEQQKITMFSDQSIVNIISQVDIKNSEEGIRKSLQALAMIAYNKMIEERWRK